ncbi:uncharacterized protein LOC134289634 [Aedes albopictus]|uniref:Endonuclease/exonuclease/phosphatase domain-containing protein n=1 Tax=Aedes albopictus TaxID=7160 RepID=A0ABM1Y0F9_AEDAL
MTYQRISRNTAGIPKGTPGGIQKEFLATVSKVDIICLSESWLNDKISDDIIYIEGYTAVRNDRVGRLGGGLIVYMSNNLSFRTIEMSCYQFGQVEYIFLELRVNNHEMLLGFFYNPPEFDCTDLLAQKFSSFELQYEHILLMGDFNTNLLKNNCDKSKQFQSFMQDFGFSSLGTVPTHFHRTGASQIDLMLTNRQDLVLRFNQIDVPFMSNHDLLFASLDVDMTRIQKPVSFRDYRNFDSSTVITMFNQIDWEAFYYINNPDILLTFFNDHVKNIFNMTVPLKHSMKLVNTTRGLIIKFQRQ